MKVYCEGCGQDCSHAYGTYEGYPYHIMCIPMRPKRDEMRPRKCSECGKYPADVPSDLCPGCDAYREHTA